MTPKQYCHWFEKVAHLYVVIVPLSPTSYSVSLYDQPFSIYTKVGYFETSLWNGPKRPEILKVHKCISVTRVPNFTPFRSTATSFWDAGNLWQVHRITWNYIEHTRPKVPHTYLTSVPESQSFYRFVLRLTILQKSATSHFSMGCTDKVNSFQNKSINNKKNQLLIFKIPRSNYCVDCKKEHGQKLLLSKES